MKSLFYAKRYRTRKGEDHLQLTMTSQVAMRLAGLVECFDCPDEEILTGLITSITNDQGTTKPAAFAPRAFPRTS